MIDNKTLYRLQIGQACIPEYVAHISQDISISTDHIELGWLHYHELLERVERLEALKRQSSLAYFYLHALSLATSLASPSLVDLHAPAPFPELTRSQTAPVSPIFSSIFAVIYCELSSSKPVTDSSTEHYKMPRKLSRGRCCAQIQVTYLLTCIAANLLLRSVLRSTSSVWTNCSNHNSSRTAFARRRSLCLPHCHLRMTPRLTSSC